MDFRKKRKFLFFCGFKKKNGWKQTLSPPTPPPVEGRIQVDRREGKKDAKKKKKKKRKRISKLWILGRKESFCFFVDLKKKRLEANAIPSHTTPGRGKNSSGQERRKERRKEKWWKWAEISREERQGLEGGCVTDSFRTILFYIFVNCSYFIFLYFLSVNCLFYLFIFFV